MYSPLVIRCTLKKPEASDEKLEISLCMRTKRLRCKRAQSRDSGPDRTIATAVFLIVTVVFLLMGFSGPSVDFKLPGIAGWIYICVVIGVATTAFVWLIGAHGKRKSIE